MWWCIREKLALPKEKKEYFQSYLTNAQQLDGDKTFQEMWRNDVVRLLKLIRCSSCRHDHKNNKYYAVFNSLHALFINFQKSDQTNDEYWKEFQAHIAMPEDYDTNMVKLVSYLIEDALKDM